MTSATPTPSALAALAQVRHLGDLPEALRRELAAAATRQTFAAGQVIYLEGEPAEAVYLLESGWIKAVRMSREGREQAMLFLRAGEIFGDISVFTGAPYPATVIALEPTVTWRIPAAVVRDLTARHPELAQAVIRRLGERILYFVQLVEDLSLRSVEARLAGTLLANAERQSDGRMSVPRRDWTTFDEMATRLGTVRDVLSRALHNLETAGLLEVRRREIVLRDLPGLEARARQ